MTTAEVTDGVLAACALADGDGTIARATALFLDRRGADEGFLADGRREIEAVVSGERDHSTLMHETGAVDISAVVAADGSRHALLTMPRPVLEPTGDAPVRCSMSQLRPVPRLCG